MWLLCWGWIDGLKKTYDENSFLQRFTPRKLKSIWSQINRDHVDRLCAAGRMTPRGLQHVDAAKSDGRWQAAYAPASRNVMPEDLMVAIQRSPKARAFFATLNSVNRYALSFRLQRIKTATVRAKKIDAFVAMLAKGQVLHAGTAKPNK